MGNQKEAQMRDNHADNGKTRPVVNILFAGEVKTPFANAVCLGLEEEGIPWECKQTGAGQIVDLAKQAADLSKLNVGIAIDGETGCVVLHHRDLPSEKPLFFLTANEVEAGTLRQLGTNAARLVKGNPLLLTVPAADPLQSDNTPGPCESAYPNETDGLGSNTGHLLVDRADETVGANLVSAHLPTQLNFGRRWSHPQTDIPQKQLDELVTRVLQALENFKSG
jgi:hypothetical protein